MTIVENAPEPVAKTESTDSYHVTISEAQKTLSNFMSAMAEDAVATYAGDEEIAKWKRTVSDVEVFRADAGVKTYASENGIDLAIDTLMYVMNFRTMKALH